MRRKEMGRKEIGHKEIGRREMGRSVLRPYMILGHKDRVLRPYVILGHKDRVLRLYGKNRKDLGQPQGLPLQMELNENACPVTCLSTLLAGDRHKQ